MKKGIANLPLHGGKAPAWLFNRMKLLAGEISLAICREYGKDELLKRLSDPFWFQAFGCVLGFDWHSSGVTTTVCGALKEGLKDISRDIGVFVCGGKGATSRKTPLELQSLSDKRLINADSEKLKYASKMAAKVDNTALQDGYQLYHHSFLVTSEGKWAVIQQGMDQVNGWARRYHWLGDDIANFVCEPHKAICCDHSSTSLNMISDKSSSSREMCTVLSKEHPDKMTREYKKILELNLPAYHPIKQRDIKPSNLYKIIRKSYESSPNNFEELLGLNGVGPGTIRALALMSELIYSTKPCLEDPARFSFTHGGKDGYPYPVNKKRYDFSIKFLKDSLSAAKIGSTEKVNAFKRLNCLIKTL